MSQSVVDDENQQRSAIFDQEDGSPGDLWAEILQSDSVLIVSEGEFRKTSMVIIEDNSLGSGSSFRVRSKGQVLSFSRSSSYFERCENRSADKRGTLGSDGFFKILDSILRVERNSGLFFTSSVEDFDFSLL